MSAQLAAAFAAVLGLVFGSFANVVIHRVPRGESLARPGSTCPGCRTPIAPRDNVPVLSWLLLRGRCRHCTAPIPVRYPLVELAMAGLWALVALRLWDTHPWALPGYLAFAFICLVLMVIDARTRRLPNRITYPAFPVVLVALGAAALLEGEPGRLGRGLLAAALAGALFAIPALVRPDWIGLGDVKFAPTLGLALGWLSWSALLIGFYAAFLLGGLAGVVALVVLRLSRKDVLPFGPWLATGALFAVLAAGPVAAWYGHLLTGP
jgi:leader peptidase (prepilin peptidase)/N-methyltransferase